MPNIVITENAVRALHETIVPIGWLIQAKSGLTAVQLNAARQAAFSLGTTIETKSAPSLSKVSNGATIGGLLLALGALAMTVGLIRCETAGDLRTPTAAGARGRDEASADRRHCRCDRSPRRCGRRCGRLLGGARMVAL